MYKIVIMNGKPCSGKTTFEELCGIFCTTYLYSTIDPIKEVAKKIGWKGTKDKEDRIFLSELKQISKKYNNFPVEWVKNQIETTISDYANVGIDIEDKYKKVIFFVDCREIKEIEELKSILPNVVTAVIVRDKNGKEYRNHEWTGHAWYSFSGCDGWITDVDVISWRYQ